MGETVATEVPGITQGDYVIGYIQPDYIWRIWRKVEPMVRDALEHSRGETSVEIVRDALLSGNMQLFLVADKETKEIIAAAGTEIGIYPLKRVLRVSTLGGKDFNKWGAEFIDALEEFARDWNLDYIEGAMRLGWKKWLEPMGWNVDYILMSKEVDNGRRTG